MNKLQQVLSGQKILEEVDSPINGHLVVKRDLAWGTYIQANGVTQSGGVAELVWRSTLRKVKGKRQEVKDCLILGLGGGSIAKIVRKNWPSAKITGVEIDPIMVELGNRHLALGNRKVEIVISDAYKFCKSSAQSLVPSAFDLICVDLYCGDKYPKKFESLDYIQLVRTVLANAGMAVFNRLYYGEKRKEAVKFGNKLEKVFSNVEWFYPEANLMFICRS
ncbi:fused MFS/spermidine synthase [Candidatus Woesebacteria bacterium]|nr:fused MFS/spermidine synthase [Candidatus Woesebacteria bacterium]